MSAMTNYLETALANHVLRNTSYTSPTTIYVGLFTGAPGEAGGGTEVSGGSYARQVAAFGAPTDGVCLNSGAITFGPASASWGTVTHFALFDAVSSGNMLIYGSITSKTVGDGDTATFAAGQLSVAFQ